VAAAPDDVRPPPPLLLVTVVAARVGRPAPSAGLVGAERPLVALGVERRAAAPAVVLVAHGIHDRRTRGERALDDVVGVVDHQVRGGLTGGRPGALAGGTAHEPGPTGPDPLAVHDHVRVVLGPVHRVLPDADGG